ncbi:MAG: hydro-lyase [Betaproteobacteria bacterium]|nr:hydro-lyase [Betaproteobacteria bacterium]
MSTIANKTVPPVTTFQGYLRSNGDVGVRNHVAVVSTVALSNRIAQLAIAQHGSGLLIHGEFQRGLQTQDAQLQELILTQIVNNSNVGAALILCHDKTSALGWKKNLSSLQKPIETLAVMESLGVQNAINSAALAIGRLEQSIDDQQRVNCPISKLIFALECGGSDASSSVCSNPAIGQFVDWVIAQGATVIVSETAEFIGAEDVVRAQSINTGVADAINACIERTEKRMAGDGDLYRGVNPTPENIEAGLTTLVEKTMGAVCKIGRASFVGCLEFGQTPTKPGLYFMDTPFFSPCSITGMVAAGAQITLFSMGVFNPSGNPLSPTIKVCGNPNTVKNWVDGIDVDISGLIQGHISMPQAGQQVANSVLKVASGEITKTEAFGEGQFILPRFLPAF